MYNCLNSSENCDGPILFSFELPLCAPFIPILTTVKALNSIGFKQTMTWKFSYSCRSIPLTFCTQEGRVKQMQASFTLCTRALPSLASHWMMKMRKPGLKWPSSERR